MKTRSVIVFVLFALCMMGAGYLVGWHNAMLKRTSVPGSPGISDQTANTASSSLPPVKTSSHGAPPVSPIVATGKTSLADIEAKMLTLKYGNLFGDSDWGKRLNDLDPSDIPQLLAFVDSRMPKFMRQRLRLNFNLLSRWAKNDPKAAMAYAQGLSNLQERQYAISEVGGGWAKIDPTAAAAWARQLPEGRLRKQVLGSVISTMAGINPQAAYQLLQASGPNYGAAYSLFSTWAAQDPAAAAAQAATLPSYQERSQVYGAIALKWAQSDPQAAIAWATSLPNERDKRNTVSSIVSGWAQNDVNAALAWVKALPKGQTKDDALRSLGPVWAQTDPQAAADFASSLPSGNTKNSMLANIFRQWAQQDPDAAMKYAQNLPSGPARTRALEQAVGSISWQDPQAATQLYSALPPGKE